MKKEKIISKIDLNYKGEDYELRFFKNGTNSYSFKFGRIKNKKISYKETNLFHQYFIFIFLIKEIKNFIYNIKELGSFNYTITNKKMNNINKYILKKPHVTFGYTYEITENSCGVFKTIIKNDEVFLNLLAELNEFESNQTQSF